MPVTRMRFRILVEPEGQEAWETEVEIRNVDRLEAEVSARGHGILGPIEEAPQHYTNLWLFHALKRYGTYAGDFREFKRDLVTFEAVDDEDVPVDPTQLVESTT